MARLRGGRDYARSLGEFQAWFGTDADCLDYLEWVRRVRAPDVSDGGDDLRPVADAADGMVHRVLAFRDGQGGDLGAELAAVAGDRLSTR